MNGMHPSTILTPPDWRHVSIHPDDGGRFRLAGYASQMPWYPADLKALGVKVKGDITCDLTKERALEIGQEIEDAVRKQEGEPASKRVKISPSEPNQSPARPESGAQKTLF